MGISILYTYTCVYNIKCIGINQENEVHLPKKECTSGHKWERIKMIVTCIAHMHITAVLKAYWLPVIACSSLEVTFANADVVSKFLSLIWKSLSFLSRASMICLIAFDPLYPSHEIAPLIVDLPSTLIPAKIAGSAMRNIFFLCFPNCSWVPIFTWW